MKNEKDRMLGWALRYHKLGWNIIPIQPNRIPFKGFEWRQYQSKLITEQEIRDWWGVRYPGAGIALITGKVSGILGLDIDAKHGRSFGEFNILPTLVSRTQTDGWHVFYRYPDYEVRSDDNLFGKGVGIKAEGGLLVLSPTKGEKGPYRWDCGVFDKTLLDDMPDFLIKAIKNKQVQNSKVNLQQIVKGVSEGNRNDSACSLIGTLLHHLPQKDWSSAWTLVDAWNLKNNPPIPQLELKAKFDALVVKESAKPVVDDSGGKNPFVEAVSIKELCELDIPPVDWDVEGLIEHGTPNMISAAPNNYKSWVIIHEAICMAGGKPLFGHFKTKKQAVMIVNEEDHRGQLKKRIQMLLGKDKLDLPIYLHIQEELKLTQDNVDKLLKEAKEKQVTCIMFDSLRAVHNADENDSSAMQEVMDFFMKFIREGITVIFTHHHRKKAREFGKRDQSGEESRGSTSINAAVHGHLTCEPKMIDGKEKLVIRQPKLKCDQKLLPFQVDIVIDENADTMKLIYEGEYDADDSLRGQAKDSIMAVLKNDATWLTKKELGSAIKVGSDSTTRHAIRELELEKKVVSKTRSELVKFKQPIHSADGIHNEKFYQLPDNDAF